MLPTIPTDFTMRHARTGMMVLSKPLEHILNTCQRLFNMVPDQDIYDKEMGMGLDIRAHSRNSYVRGLDNRDYEYEQEILKQFNAYTDIILTKVVVYFKNDALTVLLEGNWNGTDFTLRTSTDPKLATEIKPKEVTKYVSPI